MRDINIQDQTRTYPKLMDKFGRQITYLRLSITNQCNLRCTYCMPEIGIPILKDHQQLTLDEIKRLVSIFSKSGIQKIRLTGGEPFVRKDILDIIEFISAKDTIDGLFVTTNGIGVSSKIEELKGKLSGINLSLDSVDRDKFFSITRRDRLDKVLESIEAIIEAGIPLKLNSVLTKDTSSQDILDILDYVKLKNLNLRFIEEMPFNGEKSEFKSKWDIEDFNKLINSKFEISEVLSEHGSNTVSIIINDFKQAVSFIPAFTRSFCSDCSRVRVTSDGFLKNCLYGKRNLDLKEILRSQEDDSIVAWQIFKAVSGKLKDGFDSEEDAGNVKVSMSMIGG